jgi:hypothetical protein
MLDYDSDLSQTPTVDEVSIRAVRSLDALPPRIEGDGDIILPDAELEAQAETCEALPDVEVPSKLRKVAFNDAIIYYPPRPQSSRQTSFSLQISQPSSRETTPSISSPTLSHRRSISWFLLTSPSSLPSSSTTSSRQHIRERKSWAGLITSPFISARRRRLPNRYRSPTPPLGHNPLENDDDDDDDDRSDPWQPPAPIIDLDVALSPFETPGSTLSTSQSAKFWSLTSHVGTHRRSESAPEITGLGFDAPFSPTTYTPNPSDSTPSSRGLKRKMSVIDEEDRQFRTDEMEIDSELHRIILQEGAEMGEMGDLVVDSSSPGSDSDKLSKRRSWRKSLKDWWKKV